MKYVYFGKEASRIFIFPLITLFTRLSYKCIRHKSRRSVRVFIVFRFSITRKIPFRLERPMIINLIIYCSQNNQESWITIQISIFQYISMKFDEGEKKSEDIPLNLSCREQWQFWMRERPWFCILLNQLQWISLFDNNNMWVIGQNWPRTWRECTHVCWAEKECDSYFCLSLQLISNERLTTYAVW